MLGLKIFMESVWVGFFLVVPYMYVYIKVRWWWGGGAAETKHVSMGLNIPSAGRIALKAFGPWAGWNSQGTFFFFLNLQYKYTKKSPLSQSC